MDKYMKMIAYAIRIIHVMFIVYMFVCLCVCVFVSARASLSPHDVGIIGCEIPFLFDPRQISTARACSKIPANEERNRTHGQPKPAIEMKSFKTYNVETRSSF